MTDRPDNPLHDPKPPAPPPADEHVVSGEGWRPYPATMLGPETGAGLRTHRPGGDTLVLLKAVSKSFGPLRVLNGVSLDIKRGQTTVIIGPSATGKSVLLKLIVGLLTPDKGEVYFDGDRVDTMSPAELVKVRKQIGFLFQMGALFD